jgi:hypothetical protein
MARSMDVESIPSGIDLSPGRGQGEFRQGVKTEEGIEDAGEVSSV